MEPAGVEASSAENPECAMWETLQSSSNPWRVKGTKVVLGRYMDALRKIASELDHFAQRKWGYIHCVVELDMVASSKFADTLQLTPSA